MANKIESRIRKLLRIAKHADVHESANAAKRAQLLMEKHRIEVSLDDEEEERFRYSEPLETLRWRVRWKADLLTAICDANGCQGLWIKRGRRHLLMCVGPELDIGAVTYLYAYLSREIERFALELAPDARAEQWLDSFRHGAIAVITLRLIEARDQAWDEAEAQNPHALRLIEDRMDQAERIKEWILADRDVADPNEVDEDLDLDAFNLGMRTAGNIRLDALAELGDGEDTAASDG